MQVIYIDVLLLVNTAANYMLLLASAKICDAYTLRRRIFLAALVGGVYSIFAAVPTYGYLNTLTAKALCAVVMTLISFGFRKSTPRLFCVFLLYCYYHSTQSENVHRRYDKNRMELQFFSVKAL